MMSAPAQQLNVCSDTLVPLRRWIEGEVGPGEQSAAQQIATRTNTITNKAEKERRKETILGKTTVAYGIAELLRHARSYPSLTAPRPPSLDQQCSADNFVVRISSLPAAAGESRNINGVDMVSPRLSVNIAEPSFLRRIYASFDEQEVLMGRYLEVEFSSGGIPLSDKFGEAAAVCQNEEDARCHSLGALLYELFSHNSTLPDTRSSKKARLSDDSSTRIGENNTTSARVRENLSEMGFPSSVCLVVQNLLECGEANRPDNAYDSLDAVIKDIHLLLLDPNRFLFNHEHVGEENDGITQQKQLMFRRDTLYGRENEVSLITDAFCRVSSGKSEAFFIGGFSGSGKSRLVNSLTARIEAVDGYVLTHKFDQKSERPLLEVISVFNDLCLLINEKSSPEELFDVIKNLMDAFSTDFSVLARLLPNIKALTAQLEEKGDKGKGSGDQLNLKSVCFTLQRFMRVVSTERHPVMLFLDDLQWCDRSALMLVEGILCDAAGSSHFFFVGSYRSNEVQDDHCLFPLMDCLNASGVPTTRLRLEGLNPADLNSLISDALCLFPRICEPLSDIVFQKTKGNPFFVLEFLRSLVDKSLLEYNAGKRSWVWDEDSVSSMDVAGNVLHLLYSKMSGLSENMQLALKVAACFGIKIDGSVVSYLITTSEYSNIRDGLEEAVREGFMMKLGSSDFRFSHDKVREAAYSLIPDGEKNRFHYSLGICLHTITRRESNIADEIMFAVADQVNHGIKEYSSAHSPQLQIELAKLNGMAGARAVKRSDFVTACSYWNSALSLLPTEHWKSHYDLSLQLSFLYAQSANSCGDVEKAQSTIQEILVECHSIEDKLPAYYLQAAILYTSNKGVDAYNACCDALLQLGEAVPQSLTPEETKNMMIATSNIAQSISETGLLEMKDMDENLTISLKFYSLMADSCFVAKQEIYPFAVCRMVELTMQNGICKYSLLGLVQYATMLCMNLLAKDIQSASRIGKAAMSCFNKRFQTSVELVPQLYFYYFSQVAPNLEPLQLCAKMALKGFNTALSRGETKTALANALQHIKSCFFAGEKLPTILEMVDLHLKLADQYKNNMANSLLCIFRETISALIDRGESTSSKPKDEITNAFSSVTNYRHCAIQAYWLGHSERCHYYVSKVASDTRFEHLGSIVLTFLHGLSAFQLLKKNNTAKLRTIPRSAIAALKTAASHSEWNFRNKVHLLEAENYSFNNKHREAKTSYAAAIASAHSSGFIHEEGLALELAGFHYKKIGDHENALSLFSRAKLCYAEWGSQVKVDSISRQLENFHIAEATLKK